MDSILRTLGRKKSDVTSITLANNTAKTVDSTVPANKRWLLLGVKAMNPDDVGRDLYIDHYKEAAKTNLIRRLAAETPAAGARTQWPSSVAGDVTKTPKHDLMVMDAGETISILWAAGGASSGGTDADGLVVDYLEVQVS